MVNFFRTGIDLGGTKIESIVLDGQGGQVLRKRIPAPRGSYSDTLVAISDLVLEADSFAQEKTNVGLSMPGSLSKNTNPVSYTHLTLPTNREV